jgi:hypothetical protein
MAKVNMSSDQKIYVRAVSTANPFGETDSQNQSVLSPDYETPNLKPVIKQLLGRPLRQASNLVELGVIGAQTLNMRLEGNLSRDSRLYVATGMGDISKNLKLFKQVTPPVNGLAAPFDFINSSANTTAFYVAKFLDLNARNLTVSRDEFSFETALQIAVSDLSSGDSNTALVGGIDEVPNSSCTHFNEMAKKNKLIPGQGSGWLYLTKIREQALGEISQVIKVNTDNSMSIDDWSRKVVESLEENLDTTTPVNLLPGYKITESECDGLSKYLGDCSSENYIHYCGAYYTASAFGMARSFASSHKMDAQYLHVMRNEMGATMCVLMRAYGQ